MFSFLFRIAAKSALIQKYRFLALTFTIAIASTLLIILSALYFNAESQMAVELGGVPNMVVEPQKSIVETSRLTVNDLTALKSEDHFWHNNILAATPVMEAEGTLGNRPVRIAGTWFRKSLPAARDSFAYGLLTFRGWTYAGSPPKANAVITGANLPADGQLRLTLNGHTYSLPVAGTLETGSYWDDYMFVNLEWLQQVTNRHSLDKILVSSLIKPKDQLAIKVEQYGEDSLPMDQFEKWYCSPYATTVAYTINEVIPQGNVKVLRRITEVQEGVIKASSGTFLALFVLTLVAAVTAVLSAQRMYVSAHLRDYGIMTAMGASRGKIFAQLITEIGLAALLSGLISFGISKLLIGFLSHVIFDIAFQANLTLLIISVAIPFATALSALVMVKRGLNKDVVQLLR